jgi:hypothetical protein
MFSLLPGVSCNMFSKEERPYYLLTKYSSLGFNRSNTSLIKYAEEMSGLANNKGIIEAIFNIQNLDIDSLKNKMLSLAYKKLPISELEMGDGFRGNIKQSDAGYYKLNTLRGAIDVLVVVDFTQGKVILYKLV